MFPLGMALHDLLKTKKTEIAVPFNTTQRLGKNTQSYPKEGRKHEFITSQGTWQPHQISELVQRT